jgi:23S rRNA (uracil1939-C5)-methyltransferase
MNRRARTRAGADGRAWRQARAEVIGLGQGGDGIALLANGARVFVPGALPGEQVELRYEPAATGASRAVLTRLLAPSAERGEPLCPYLLPDSRGRPGCGGCDWLHLTQAKQHELYRARLLDALRRRARLEPPDAITIGTPGGRLGYRCRARLAGQNQGGRLRLGYRRQASHEIVDVVRCIVLRPELDEVIAALREVLAHAEGAGEIDVAIGASRLGVGAIDWEGELGPQAFATAAAIVSAGRLAGLRLLPRGASRPADFGDVRPRQRLADGDELVLAAAGFGQPSDEGAVALGAAARAALGALGPRGRVLELFAGSGTLSVSLAGASARLTAVERDEAAVRCWRENLGARAPHARVAQADAEAIVPEPGLEAAVLDPPRGGAPRAVVALARARARRLVYVSCNPATLARDLGTLCAEGYGLRHLELLDLFPQTSHVEAVAVVERTRRQ